MKQNNFKYYFTPAAITSNFVPLIVILYAKQEIDLVDFEYKMWNTLQISSFTKEESAQLKELIIEISESNECEEYIFMYAETKELDKGTLEGVIPEENTMYASKETLQNRDNLKKVLDEFEKMVPEL